jgi:hypothetical protein
LEFDSSMMMRPDRGVHDLGGSPSKFQPGRREIRLDDRYLQELSGMQRAEMRRLVGPAADWCGYD